MGRTQRVSGVKGTARGKGGRTRQGEKLMGFLSHLYGN